MIIGKKDLSGQIPPRSLKLVLNKLQKKFLWLIHSKQCQQGLPYEWTDLLQNQSEWPVAAINISKSCFNNTPQSTNYTTLINNLTKSIFPNLVQLNLDLKGTTSIQSLYKLNAPFLSSLSLKSEDHLQLKSLRKCHFPQIRFITISAKGVKSWEWLVQIQQNKLQKIVIDDHQTIQESSSYAQVCVLRKLNLSFSLAMKNIHLLEGKKLMLNMRQP